MPLTSLIFLKCDKCKGWRGDGHFRSPAPHSNTSDAGEKKTMPPRKIVPMPRKTKQQEQLYERTVTKRGNGLLKKAMEFAIISGGEVFIALRLPGDNTQNNRDAVLTFTSGEDRNWRKHAQKLIEEEETRPTVRLDTCPRDYEMIFHDTPRGFADKVPRGVRRPFFHTPRTAHIVAPQLAGEGYTKKEPQLVIVQALAQEAVNEYFQNNEDAIEESTVVLDSPNPEDQAEDAAIDYQADGYFRPPRQHWLDTTAHMRQIRLESRHLLRQSKISIHT